ncbi:MAG: hypothetical protein AAF960_12215 [Bacteroidota bacterium]
MKRDEREKLIAKYREGISTLEEENFLFNNAVHSEPSLEAWSLFVKNNKIEAPENFNDSLWISFQNKKVKKRRRFISVLSAAASVLLIISFFAINKSSEKQSYAEKERLLRQALEMFDDLKQKEIQQTIFYENEMIVLYTIIE